MSDYFSPSLDGEELGRISMLGLAHLGDSVYETMVRTMLTLRGKETASGMHADKLRYVTAPEQARRSLRIRQDLTPEEEAVFRRGKNAAPHTYPRTCTREEYRTATAVEALFGWLYLQGQRDRLNTLFELMMGDD